MCNKTTPFFKNKIGEQLHENTRFFGLKSCTILDLTPISNVGFTKRMPIETRVIYRILGFQKFEGYSGTNSLRHVDGLIRRIFEKESPDGPPSHSFPRELNARDRQELYRGCFGTQPWKPEIQSSLLKNSILF